MKGTAGKGLGPRLEINLLQNSRRADEMSEANLGVVAQNLNIPTKTIMSLRN